MSSDSAPIRKPLEGDAALIRAVGSFALAAAVMNIIVGGGIFRMPSALSAQVGIAAPLALVAGALAIIPVALCFAAIGSRAVATGGPYSYLGATFGNFAGFVAGALMWISNVASSAGVAAAFSVQVANLVPWFGQPLPRAGLLTALYLILYALNAFGVKLGARAITTLAALKLTPLFLLAGAGLFFVDWTQVSFDPRAVPSWAALGTGMVLVMFAYSGMETALVPSGEVRDPSRSVPRATMAAILLVVLLYMGLQVVNQGVLGPALAKSGVPIADTAAALWAPGRVLLLVTACISMAGFLLGNLLGSSRLLFALGRDGYMPHAYGRVSATHRVPLLALATHAGFAWLLALGGTFDALALISGGAICLVYALVGLAAWRGQKTDLRERGGEPFLLWGGPLVPLLAVVAMGLIVTTLTGKEWLAIGVALAGLGVVYAVVRGLKSRQA
ncbi:APC family permease [Pseudoxanthomonas yeongjuensis]|uniref:APC family permease n=1 Tax=Pseudoxanthomonas yeongjuensis TaxID=377616 RepID=UPI001391DF6E|nr:APC family permease [Pseudoxanthomonas yeongjuensis]